MFIPFWDEHDIVAPFGKVAFGAEYLRNEGRANGYPSMQYGCDIPRDEGGVWVYGWSFQNWEEKDNRTMTVIRCWTEDGRNFAGEEVVFKVPGQMWQGYANIIQRPTDDRLFLWSWEGYEGLHVYSSNPDGSGWRRESASAYRGHDAMCIIWHPGLSKFLNYQTTLQKFPKRYPDNIGSLRRVLSFRTSTNGVQWNDLSPEFLNGELLWLPDEQDPPDLEFYRPVVFPHMDRYAMILVDYEPPPSEANSRRALTKHGPPYATEWAISRDGLNWKRPFRDINIYEDQFWLSVQGPLAMEGKLRFYHPGGEIASLDGDRIFYVTCNSNGEFSTPTFTMPENGLLLNTYAKYREVELPNGRAYVMCELWDQAGNAIEGYERTKCVIENVDDHDLPLRWDGNDGSDLAGRSVSLRILLRDAKIYSLTAAP